MVEEKVRDSFIVYRSFRDAIKKFPDSIRLQYYEAIFEYGLDGIVNENLDPIAEAVFTIVKEQLKANKKRYENGCSGGRPKKNKETVDYRIEKPMVFNEEKPMVIAEKKQKLLDEKSTANCSDKTIGYNLKKATYTLTDTDTVNYTLSDTVNEEKNIKKENFKKINSKNLNFRNNEIKLKFEKYFDLSFVEKEFEEPFMEWLDYKMSRKQTYKTQQSIEICYNNLKKYSDNNPIRAKEVVEKSIGNGWSGIFELKQMELNCKANFEEIKNKKIEENDGVVLDSHELPL